MSLRAAITDLMETFGARYPKGAEYLARLDALKPSLPSHPASQAALATLAREALMANPLIDFDQLLLVKRRPLKKDRKKRLDVPPGGG